MKPVTLSYDLVLDLFVCVCNASTRCASEFERTAEKRWHFEHLRLERLCQELAHVLETNRP